MSTAESSEDPTSDDPTSEQMAAALVSGFVEKATAATVEWLQDCAIAFGSSVTRAAAGEYTANDLAKDAAAQWARNVTYTARMFGIAAPGDATDETTTDA